MPGIVGVIAKIPPGERAAMLAAMLKPMLHESFYATSRLQQDELGIGVGWVCHQGSFSACLPVWNEKRDVCLIFSGEDHADKGLVDDLKSKGHIFDPGKAGYLVHLYEELGLPFLEKINGWFSGLLLDLRERKLVLFNDRYGMNRIYYHENANGFFFSSEAKSLLKILPELRRLDPQGLGEFMACGCVLQNRTLFHGISLMPGGSAWVFSPGQPVRKEAYFRKETWEEQPLLNDRD